jgi:putative sigma-54 modulation protein
MVKKFEIHGVHMSVDPKLLAYTTKKIGRLDRFVQKHARQSMHVEVTLKAENKKSRKSNVCEVIIKLPGETIAAKEATINMYAAVDIVEAKLKNALKKYKDTHGSRRIHRRMLSRIKRMPFTAFKND